MVNGWLGRLLGRIASKQVDEQGTERWYVTSPVFVYVLIFLAAVFFFVALYNLLN